MNDTFMSLESIENAMTAAMRNAQIAKARGDAFKELQHMATANRLADLRNAVDAYGNEILLPPEAFDNR